MELQFRQDLKQPPVPPLSVLFIHAYAFQQDSPINKLLYARDIPRYKQMVERWAHISLKLVRMYSPTFLGQWDFNFTIIILHSAFWDKMIYM